jgi:type IV secretion system protein VirB2
VLSWVEAGRVMDAARESLSPRVLQICTWSLYVLAATAAALMPELVFAQASPFATGAAASQTNILTILTPIAVIAVMALGVAAWFNKISWGWAVAGVIGIVLVFGSQQIVTWVRGMFGV